MKGVYHDFACAIGYTSRKGKTMKRRMRFVTWAKKDPDDETKIFYTFRIKETDKSSKTIYFTSEDTVSYSMIERIRVAWIEKIEKVNDAWNVIIYED